MTVKWAHGFAGRGNGLCNNVQYLTSVDSYSLFYKIHLSGTLLHCCAWYQLEYLRNLIFC